MILIAGLAAWYLMVFQVLLGAVYAAGMGRLMIAPRIKLRLHRWSAIGLAAAVGTHVSAILLTRYRGWGFVQVLEVGRGPIARNCGVVALWLLIVVTLSRWRPVFGKLGPVIGRRVHLLAYPLLVLGTLHGLLAGPNTGSLAVAGPGIAALSGLAAAYVGRYHKNLAGRRTRKRRARHVQSATV